MTLWRGHNVVWFIGVLVPISLLISFGLLWLPVAGFQMVAITFVPSAERAYSFGQWYFDVDKEEWYHPGLAAWFYKKALQHDKAYPYARHQLSRIAFLRGEYATAQALITAEINLPAGPRSPSSWYVRGLIRGFAGEYRGAIEDYREYLKSDPHNWAAQNDLAWVLLRDNQPLEALMLLDSALMRWPDNAWLLNNYAIALAEVGRTADAARAAQRAAEAVSPLRVDDWNKAYPGNDPAIGKEGLAHFTAAIMGNAATLR